MIKIDEKSYRLHQLLPLLDGAIDVVRQPRERDGKLVLGVRTGRDGYDCMGTANPTPTASAKVKAIATLLDLSVEFDPWEKGYGEFVFEELQ